MDLTCFNWIQVIKKDRELSFHSKAIAMYLSTFMNAEHDTAWPSQQRISDELGISKPTVIKYIKELESAEYLTISKKRNLSKGGDQEYNCYQVGFPLRVVKEINSLTSRVVNARGKGSKPHTTKGVNHVNTNNNINNNRISKIKFPFFEDNGAWETLGKKHGLHAKPKESWGEFKNRVRRELEG